jgi:hypothetical protein
MKIRSNTKLMLQIKEPCRFKRMQFGKQMGDEWD